MNATPTKNATPRQRVRSYHQAAEVLERKDNYACCLALNQVGAKSECKVMKEWFQSGDFNQRCGHWMTTRDEGSGDPDTEGEDKALRHRRIVALCFMAAMVEAGDA